MSARIVFGIILASLACLSTCEARSHNRKFSEEISADDFPQACCQEVPQNKDNVECCKIPKEDLWNGWELALNACRVAIDKAAQAEGQVPVSTSTENTEEVNPAENETDSDENDEDDDDDDDEVKPVEATIQKGREGKKHGKRRGSKHRGRGRAIKCAMEKMGWSTDNKINYEKIAEDTGKDIKEPSEDMRVWIESTKEVISNCSQRAKEREEKRNEKANEKDKKGKCHHHHRANFTTEAEAMHCFKRSLKSNCPKYNDTVEHCVAKQKFKKDCGLWGRKLNNLKKKYCLDKKA